jgi:signal transduction histidine kinase
MVEGEINHWLEEVLDQITIPEPVSLVCDMSPGLPRVPFDRDKLHRVVINLVNNAVQAVIERQERFKQEDELYQPQVKLATSVVELAIVKKIVEEHGGSVTLESEPDRGTRATVVIPVQPQSFT